MTQKTDEGQLGRSLRHPLLEKLCAIAEKLTGIRIMIVHPSAKGWDQFHPAGNKDQLPDLCRIIQDSSEGAKHCRMCHVLMSVAACSGSTTDQRCHAGASVMVIPASEGKDETLAVLSSCLYSDEESWKETEARGRKLGLDNTALRKAHDQLMQLPPERIQLARELMQTIAEAVKELRTSCQLSARIEKMQKNRSRSSSVRLAIEEQMQNALSGRTQSAEPVEADSPMIIQVLKNLVSARPDLSFSVKEIATVARITPNHFSMIFHRHTGQTFSEYLADKRIEKSKELLQDLTMNVTEVARGVGYDDPGYFTRRFRQKTGKSPRVWRQRVSSGRDQAEETATPAADRARKPAKTAKRTK